MKVGDRVSWSGVCGPEYIGKYAGKILGFYNSDFIILELHAPTTENLAEVIHVSALVLEHGRHKWEMEGRPGEYDTVYFCPKCKQHHIESIDKPNSEPPEYGCV